MGIDKTALKEHLKKRLRAHYSEEELDLIVKSLLENPARPPLGLPGHPPTYEELKRDQRPGAWDPTGTVVRYPSDPTGTMLYMDPDLNTIAHWPPSGDLDRVSVSFVVGGTEKHMSAAEMEELAQAIAKYMGDKP